MGIADVGWEFPRTIVQNWMPWSDLKAVIQSDDI